MMQKASLRVISLISALLLAFSNSLVLAEDHDQTEYLGDLTVNATRVDKSLYEIPASVSYVGMDEIQLGRQQLGIDEALVKIPGLFMQNRYNFAQDLRISIRGFGSRATFGIRGIKLIVDGIPATLPDGQGGVDSIDIGSLERMEVIRGPSSSLYGTAAGGVINMYTEDGPLDGPFVEGRASFGSDNFRKFQIKTGGQKDKLNYLVNLSRLELDGYRDNSRTENFLVNSKFRYDIDNTSDITLTANAIDSPEAQDPGGLSRTRVPFNPAPGSLPPSTGLDAGLTSAQRNNVRFDAGESVEQQQIGLLYNKSVGEKHDFILRNYYVFRNFNTNLPFGREVGAVGGIVGLDRFFTGGGGQYSYSDNLFGHKNRLTVGFDIDSQMDERINYQNIANSSAFGPKSLDQDEDVFSWGIFLQNEFSITDSLALTAGVRYDEVEFDFTDKHFVDGTDDSGKITFTEWSPQAGLLWSVNDAVNIYGNIGTSFEPPSTREFAHPTAASGFNPSLSAQTAINYEIGVKGFLSSKINYELAVFRIETEDELVLLGNNPLSGANFFSNAGETTRNGLEAALTVKPLQGLDVSFAYTYSDFEFDKFTVGGTSFKGNAIPGIPQQTAFIELAYYHPSGFYSIWDTQLVDQVFVDNANSDEADDYIVSNLRLGYTIDLGDKVFTPFVGINNIFDQNYIGAVRVNESNTRFFEPAPDMNLYAGMSLRFN